MLAVMMSNAGGAWDNAKKYVENEKVFGGKKSATHKACVVGDTVGDPFKDTSGPALNILIKLMTVISLTLAPIFRDDWDTWWQGLLVLILEIVLCGVAYYYVWAGVCHTIIHTIHSLKSRLNSSVFVASSRSPPVKSSHFAPVTP